MRFLFARQRYFLSSSITRFVFIVITLQPSFIFAQENTTKPNILFIAVDDLKPNLGCFGDSMAITPHIDALAQKGMVFTNTHCQQAVCAPSRASLLTSRYPDQTEVWDLETMMRDRNPEILTLPEYFKNNGYTTAGVGKIFDPRSVDSNKDTPSWDAFINQWQSQWYSSTSGKPLYFYALPSAKDTITLLQNEAGKLGVDKQTYVKQRYWPSVEKADVPYDAYVDGAITNIGVSLLNQNNNSDKPFFLAVGFQRPHLPFNAPKQFWDLYEREKFKIAEFQEKAQNSPSIAYHNYNELRSYTDIPETGNLSEEKQLELIHAYYAAISYIDFCVGKLTQELKELNLADNTIIVLWGDHGWHLGDHNLWCKHSNFEQATRSPLIISYPGQSNQGKSYSFPTEFTDIAPTLCDLTGLRIPVDFEGESLVSVIENPEIQIREGALSQYPRSESGTKYMGYSFRTERYRYTKWINRNDKSHYTSELYDYQNDPLETINLTNVTAYATVKSRLDSMVSERIEIPSTQEKIRFNIKSKNSNDQFINVSNAQINFSDALKQTDVNGEALFTHVPGEYNFSVKKKGYKPIDSSIIITNDTTVNLILENELYDVNIVLQASWNKQVLENARVKFNNIEKITDQNGNVFYPDISFGLYNIDIELENGWKQTFYNQEIFSDTSLLLQISEPSYNVTVNAINKYTSSAIYQCGVMVNSNQFFTNNSGNVSIKIPAGKYKLQLNHEKYTPYTDSVVVTGDTTFFIKLLPAYSNIKFRLKENTTPVNKANVTINGQSVISNNLGISNFKNLETFINYKYVIEKEAYKVMEGNLFLVNDTSIDVQMQKLETKVDQKKIKEIKFWPNPFQSELKIQNLSNRKIDGTIQNITGKKILNFGINASEIYRWDSGTIKSGVYILTVNNENKTSVYKLIKTE